jgi:hypothetical protein
MPALLLLGVLATCGQRRFYAEIRPAWREALSLWPLVLLSSGERKSAVFKRCLAPVYERQRELLKAGSGERARALAELAAAEAQLKHSTMAKRKPGESGVEVRAQRDELVAEVERLKRLVPPDAVLMLNDVTPEKFGVVLSEVGAVTIASDEGGVFSTFGGRYNNGVANIDLLMKSHSGEAASVDRIGRGRTVIDEPACTMVMAVQPDVLIEATKRSEFRNRGGLARFLYAMPTSRLGRRSSRGAVVMPPRIAEAYRNRILALLPAEPPKGRADEPHTGVPMVFTPAARAELERFADALEPRLDRTLGDLAHMADWASKLPGALARIAALFELSEHGPGEVSVESVRNALLLAPFLEAHARVALALTDESEALRDARQLLRWISASAARPSASARHTGATSTGSRRAPPPPPRNSPTAALSASSRSPRARRVLAGAVRAAGRRTRNSDGFRRFCRLIARGGRSGPLTSTTTDSTDVLGPRSPMPTEPTEPADIESYVAWVMGLDATEQANLEEAW